MRLCIVSGSFDIWPLCLFLLCRARFARLLFVCFCYAELASLACSLFCYAGLACSLFCCFVMQGSLRSLLFVFLFLQGGCQFSRDSFSVEFGEDED